VKRRRDVIRDFMGFRKEDLGFRKYGSDFEIPSFCTHYSVKN
jgi:hypothetical protein